MRKYFIMALIVAAVVIAFFLLAPSGSSPVKTWPEVTFQGTTNRTGTNVALFRIVNHGPGPVMLWLPPRLRMDSGLGPEIEGFRGHALEVGESITTAVPFPQEAGKWQAGFLYDYGGWRSTVQDWGWLDREQKWTWSDWVEP